MSTPPPRASMRFISQPSNSGNGHAPTRSQLPLTSAAGQSISTFGNSYGGARSVDHRPPPRSQRHHSHPLHHNQTRQSTAPPFHNHQPSTAEGGERSEEDFFQEDIDEENERAQEARWGYPTDTYTDDEFGMRSHEQGKCDREGGRVRRCGGGASHQSFSGTQTVSSNGSGSASGFSHRTNTGGAQARRSGFCGRSSMNRALCMLTVTSVVVMGCASAGIVFLARSADGFDAHRSDGSLRTTGESSRTLDDARLLILATRPPATLDWAEVAARHPHWRDHRSLTGSAPPTPLAPATASVTKTRSSRDSDQLLSRMHFRVADTSFTVQPILEELIRLLDVLYTSPPATLPESTKREPAATTRQ